MGNNPSTTHRRVQPSLSHSFKYDRLSSSPCPDNQQPLLIDNHHECLNANVEQQQLKLEIIANKKRNEILEKKNANLERAMAEFKAAFSSQKEPPSNTENEVVALEKQLLELKSTISSLKSKSSQLVTPGPGGTGSETTILKKKVERLELRLMTVELDYLAIDAATGAQKVAELEKQILELTQTHQMRPKSSDCKQESDCLVTLLEQKFRKPGHVSITDIFGCFVALIFLVSVLIGLNM